MLIEAQHSGRITYSLVMCYAIQLLRCINLLTRTNKCTKERRNKGCFEKKCLLVCEWWVDINHKPWAWQLALLYSADLFQIFICALCLGRYRFVRIIVLDREPSFITHSQYLLKYSFSDIFWSTGKQIFESEFIIAYVLLEVKTSKVQRVISSCSFNVRTQAALSHRWTGVLSLLFRF